MLKFRDVDFIGLGSLLSEDERLVRDNTRRWVEENVIPIIEATFSNAKKGALRSA